MVGWSDDPVPICGLWGLNGGPSRGLTDFPTSQHLHHVSTPPHFDVQCHLPAVRGLRGEAGATAEDARASGEDG